MRKCDPAKAVQVLGLLGCHVGSSRGSPTPARTIALRWRRLNRRQPMRSSRRCARSADQIVAVVVAAEMHASPQPHIRFKKAYRDPGCFETASPRFRHDTHAADSTWLFWLEG